MFLSARSIRAGDNYVSTVFDNLRRCEVLLAVMGPDWLAHARPGHLGFDWVHREIAEALDLGIRVIPVLLDDASLPDPAALPARLTPVAGCHYVRLRHYTLDADLAHLAAELRRTTTIGQPPFVGAVLARMADLRTATARRPRARVRWALSGPSR